MVTTWLGLESPMVSGLGNPGLRGLFEFSRVSESRAVGYSRSSGLSFCSGVRAT